MEKKIEHNLVHDVVAKVVQFLVYLIEKHL